MTCYEGINFTPEPSAVFPLDSVQPAVGGDESTFRDTIILWTMKLQPTVDALPQLLGQLDIPVDAVGVVIEVGRAPGGSGVIEREGTSAQDDAGSKTEQQSSDLRVKSPEGDAIARDNTDATAGDAPKTAVEDCWNGVLSDDPLHCYILEEAQREGQIDVVAMYLARDGGALYIFLSQTAPISDAVGDFLRAKAHEYLRNAGSCGDYTGDERTRCFDEALYGDSYIPLWRNFQYWSALPDSRGYSNTLLRVGGAEGRRSEPGWASWSQVWPPRDRSARASSGFDVSDVDVTNIPDPDCRRDFLGIMVPSCYVWEDLGESGVTGLYPDPQSDTLYFHVKSPLPESELGLKALRRKLSSYNPERYATEIVPVRYDLGQLWRWSVILNRFSVSPGNTVGIVRARVYLNYAMYEDSRDVWMNGAEPAALSGYSDVRNILQVFVLDTDQAVTAFPELLPQLSIPADAVGLAVPMSGKPVRVSLLGSETVSSEEARGADDADQQTEAGAGSETAGQATESPSGTAADPKGSAATGDGTQGSEVSSEGAESEEAVTVTGAATEQVAGVVAAVGGNVAEVSPGAFETNSGDAREPSTDVAPSESAVSRWVLVTIVGAVALAAVVLVALLGARFARRHA